MTVQVRTDFTNYPFILSGKGAQREAETIAQDAGRTTPLVKYTVMTYVGATGKWSPYTTIATEVPCGIYLGGDITAAELVAGDVVNRPILVGGLGCTVDESQLVFENSLTLESVVAALSVTTRIALSWLGIFSEATIDGDELEN